MEAIDFWRGLMQTWVTISFLSLGINAAKIRRTFKMGLEILNLENSNWFKKNEEGIVKTNMWRSRDFYFFTFKHLIFFFA